MKRLATVVLLLSLLFCLSALPACTCGDDDDNDDDNADDDMIIDDDDDDTGDDDDDDDTGDDDDDDDTGDDDDDDDDTIDDDTGDDDTGDDDTGDDDTGDDDTIDPNNPTNEDGFFVTTTGDDDNPGTREAPLRTVAKGVSLAALLGKAVFVAGGDYGEAVAAKASLYGGYCLPGWTRDSAQCPTSLRAVAFVDITGRLTMNGMQVIKDDTTRTDVAVLVNSADVVLVDNEIRTATQGFFQTALKVVDATLTADGNVIVGGDLDATGFFDSGESFAIKAENSTLDLRNNILHAGNLDNFYDGTTIALYASNCESTLVGNELVSGKSYYGEVDYSTALSVDRGRIIAINNLIRSQQSRYSYAAMVLPLNKDENCELFMIGNTLIAGESTIGGAALYSSTQASISAANNIFKIGAIIPQTEGGVIYLVDDPTEEKVYLANNAIYPALSFPLLKIVDQEVTTIWQINQCLWPSCAAAGGNINENPLFVSSHDFHLTADSPCIDAGIDPSPWYNGAEIYVDIDGQARPMGDGWDIGMDEVPAR